MNQSADSVVRAIDGPAGKLADKAVRAPSQTVETKDLIGLSLLFIATVAGVAVTCISYRARDAAFFVAVAATVLTDKLDINFLSQFWYRGTTRGLEFSFVDVLAVSVLISSLLRPRPGESRLYWPASLGLMLLFFVYAGLAVVASEPRLYGLFELSKMLRGLVFFLAAALFVRSQREVAILVFALCCALSFEGAVAIKQRYVDGVHRVSGSLDHPNSLSMYLCMASPLLVAAATSTLPKLLRWFSVGGIALASVGILLTISRAGIPIFAVVMFGAAAMCTSWRITPKKIAGMALIALCLTGLVFKSWDMLKARYAEATFEEEYLDEKVEGRGYYLRLAKAIMEDRFFGFGLNNWSYWVSKSYGAKVGTPYEDYDDHAGDSDKDKVADMNFAAPAHNLGALVVGELGVPGLMLFALLWLRWFQMGASFLWKRTPLAIHRLGVGILFGTGGIFLQSVTEWTYRQTHIYLTFHLLLGTLASLYWLKRKLKRRQIEVRAMPEENPVHYETVGA